MINMQLKKEKILIIRHCLQSLNSVKVHNNSILLKHFRVVVVSFLFNAS